MRHTQKINKTSLWRRIYDFYTSDLSYKDFDDLIKREAPEVYFFYSSEISKTDSSKGKISQGLIFLKNLFLAFLKKLSPTIRIVYTASLLLFIYGYLHSYWFEATFAFVVMNFLLAFEVAYKLKIKDELVVARNIQASLIPKVIPEFAGFDIACYYESAKEVGGDYYDFLKINSENNSNHILIGDISGKGMAAALYMVQVRAMIHYLSEKFNSPKELLIELNKNVNKIFQAGNFFTTNILTLNEDNKLKFLRAGHLPLYHFQSEKSDFKTIKPKGIGLGLSSNGQFENALCEESFLVQSGDILILFTDGVTEAMNNMSNEFGDERLKKVIVKNANNSTSDILRSIVDSIYQFSGTTYLKDDLTLVVIKVK